MIHITSDIIITSQNEARYTGYETTEKTIEGKSADEATIHELDNTRQKHIQ